MNEASAIDIMLGLSKEDFLDIILLERRKEFAFEGSHFRIISYSPSPSTSATEQSLAL